MTLTMPFAEAADRVKQSLDIVEIVQRYVVLKKSGRNYTGKCPFHNDKNPSMSVNREKNLFKCFSCGEGGDAIGFLMRKENLSYPELIREIAQEQGITIISEGKSSEQVSQERDTRQKLLDLNTATNEWFQKQLQTPEAQPVRDYLSNRRMSPTTTTRFQLGFAPPGWENLANHLRSRLDYVRQTPNLLMEAGLVNNRDNSQGFYDRFRNRLIIPIHDDKGQVVAFGGRALVNQNGEEEKPKYLNSPETQLYKKNQILYGLHLAKESIRNTATAVVMEGYFDVIAAHEAGISQAVGSCGTALTDNHLKLLARHGAETIYLAFDSDDAGLKAALSAIQMIEPYLDSTDLQVKVMVVPDGKDPDDYIRSFPEMSNAGEAMRQLMAQAKPFLEFKLDMAIRGRDLSTSKGRLDVAYRLTPLLSAIRKPLVRSEYVRFYSDRLQISEEALMLEIQRYEQSQNAVYGRSFEQRKNSSKKQAISKHGSTSYKRHKPVLMDNLTELRVALSTWQDTPERNLLCLVLLSNESYRIMSSFLSTCPNLALADSRLSALWHDMQVLAPKVDTAVDNPLGTLIDGMNLQYIDRPDLQGLLSDLVFSAESLAESLDLGGLTGAPFQEKIVALARKYVDQIEASREQTLLKKLQDEEPDEIELQYLLREKLSRHKSAGGQRLGQPQALRVRPSPTDPAQ